MVNGSTLKEIREAHGMTQGALAKQFNISPSTLSHYERGLRTPSIAFLKQFAALFDLDEESFFNLLMGIGVQEGTETPYTVAHPKEAFAKESFAFLSPQQIRALPIPELQKIKDYAEYIFFKYHKRKRP